MSNYYDPGTGTHVIVDGMIVEQPCKYSWRTRNKDGYYGLAPKYHDGYYYLHRKLYAEHHNIDLRGSKLEVRHLCNNPSCIELTHLQLGTHKENMYDAIKIGNHISDKTRILSNEDVDEIRRLYKRTSLTQKEISEKFGVTRQHITSIINGVKRRKLSV
jgi:DNA-binding XRE family transcriptional regulator